MITLAVTAKNEEKMIDLCLSSIEKAALQASKLRGISWDLWVILDDCEDNTEIIVKEHAAFQVLFSSGGLVEAQRQALQKSKGEYIIFCDADINLEINTLIGLIDSMSLPNAQVAYPRKYPIPPQKSSLIANALFTYNRVNGYQTPRKYFNGKCFAIRDWYFPHPAECEKRAGKLKPSKFYNFTSGMRIDDIWLSRYILKRYGPDAIIETDRGYIHYRPAETLSGMYHTYRRMRLEIERLDLLFPETKPTRKSGVNRKTDWRLIRKAATKDIFYWGVFHVSLRVCIFRYFVERFYYQHLSTKSCEAWIPIKESKQPFTSD